MKTGKIRSSLIASRNVNSFLIGGPNDILNLPVRKGKDIQAKSA
jgi:hypothetical protein